MWEFLAANGDALFRALCTIVLPMLGNSLARHRHSRPLDEAYDRFQRSQQKHIDQLGRDLGECEQRCRDCRAALAAKEAHIAYLDGQILNLRQGVSSGEKTVQRQAEEIRLLTAKLGRP